MAKRRASTNTSPPHNKRARTLKKVQQADNDVDASQTGSPFFNKLNADVRMIVYEYLHGWLPPLASKSVQRDCRGLILSCKQANMELSEAAARHLKLWMKNFSKDLEEKHERPVTLYKAIPLHDGWQALRSIVLKIDVRFCYDEDVQCYGDYGYITRNFHCTSTRFNWHYGLDIDVSGGASESNVLNNVVRILRKPFDKVTILFACPSHNVVDIEGNEIQDPNTEGSADDDSEDYNSDDSETTVVRAKLGNILANLQTMHRRLGMSICSDWVRFLAFDDHRKGRQYAEDPSVVQPHDCQGRFFDDPSGCEKCREDCAQHWKCTHPDECGWWCDEYVGSCECYGQCDGLDCACPWPHEVIGEDKAQRSCENKLADDAFTLGPKSAAYKSRSEYNFAYAQWERITEDCGPFACYGPGKPDFDGYDYAFGKPTGKEPKRIQTNEIVYAWDFRASSEPFGGKLTGGTYRYSQKHVKELAKYDHLHVPKTTAEYDEHWPSRYLLESDDLQVGMMGSKHPKRWAMASEEMWYPDGMHLGVNHFLEEDDGARRTETESRGVGMPIVELRQSKKKV
ncbi:uncharacterized protein N0V89_003566 [Didymosphaeria variabile]|uniref:Uncharacterized protein n=1 Tax=Didymosphaeria variabile TaxID=1932322 RepID=A0A9W8XQI5_9PLEO|nr:uncharacterized protein N0V89_003566 [Didymosphaeria variabile]KAJ4355548.1 hypothetical protein N0V89_003566 [Didymosphaeria variabile]